MMYLLSEQLRHGAGERIPFGLEAAELLASLLGEPVVLSGTPRSGCPSARRRTRALEAIQHRVERPSVTPSAPLLWVVSLVTIS